MATERLHVEVVATGPEAVSNAFSVMAVEMGKAGKAYKALKSELAKIATKGLTKSLGGITSAVSSFNKQVKLAATGTEKMGRASNASVVHLNKMKTAASGADGAIGALNEELRSTRRVTARAANGVKEIGASSRKATGKVKGLSNQVFHMQRAFTVLSGALVIRQYVKLSDTYQGLQNRIKLVTSGTEHFARVQERLFSISKNTRASISATVETFVRLKKATNGVASDAQLFGTLETINSMLAVSGASTQEAEQGIRQLSQAFSKGKLDGDEFRTVSEALPDILDLISASTGRTRAELRDMSEAGEITTAVMLKAFSEGHASAAKKLADSTFTVGQAFLELKNQSLKSVGALNESSGAIGILISAVRALADNFEWALAAVQLWVSYIAGRLAISAFASMVAGIISLIDVMGKLAIVLGTTNALGIMVVAAGAAFIAITKLTGGWEGLSSAIAGVETRTVMKQLTDSQKEYNKQLDDGYRKYRQLHDLYRSGTSEEYAAADSKEQAQAFADNAQRQIDALKAKELAVVAAKSAREELTKAYKKSKAAMFPLIEAQKQLAANTQIGSEVLADSTLSVLDKIAAMSELVRISQKLTSADSYIKDLKAEVSLLKTSAKNQREVRAEKEASTVTAKLYGVALSAQRTKEEAEIKALLIKKDALSKTSHATVRSTKSTTSAARENEKLLRSYEALVAKLNPYLGVVQKLRKTEDLLLKLHDKGIISAERRLEISERMRASLKSSLAPAAEELAQAKVRLQQSRLYGDELIRQQQIQEKIDLRKKIGGGALGRVDKILGTDLTGSVVDQIVPISQLAKANERLTKTQNDYWESVLKSDKQEALDTYLMKLGVLITRYNKTGDLAAYVRDQEAALLELKPQLATAMDTITAAQKPMLAVEEQHILNLEAIAQLEKNGTFTATERAKASVDEADRHRIAVEAIRAQKDELAELKDLVQTDMTNAFMALSDSIVEASLAGELSFARLKDLGKSAFKDMVDSMLKDLTRLLIKMAIAEAMKAGLGGTAGTAIGGAGATSGIALGGLLLSKMFAHGGSFGVGHNGLPRFAHGGSFDVGGAGGPDTKLVQFMASPGERVSVTSPGQTRMDSRNKEPMPQPVNVHVNNITDPSEIPDAMASPQGDRVILNTIRKNSHVLRKLLR